MSKEIFLKDTFLVASLIVGVGLIVGIIFLTAGPNEGSQKVMSKYKDYYNESKFNKFEVTT